MKNPLAQVLAQDGNLAVVTLPNRQFPGVVIQGDSLWLMLENIRTACEQAENVGSPELKDVLEELKETLEAAISRYEACLSAHGIALPYTH